MDSSERIVLEYLSHLGFNSIVYEPDGNVPPDFLIDGRIAVEVRRLNQHKETAAGPRGLEQVAYPLDAKFRRLLATLGPPINGECWFVSYTFRRPLPSWNQLASVLREHLAAFRDGDVREARTVRISRQFRIDFIRASHTHPHFFMLGGSMDDDSGGFVVSEMSRNIRICVADKTRKVEQMRTKYPEWWLALVDRIGYGLLSESEQMDLRETIRLDRSWDKIVLVSPLDPQRGFEL